MLTKRRLPVSRGFRWGITPAAGALFIVCLVAGGRVGAQPEPTAKIVGPPKVWTANGWEPVPGNSDYTVGGGSSVRYSGPTQAQLAAEAARERRAKAHEFNEAGLAAWNRGEWAVAGEQFRQAYSWNPDSKVIFNNLISAYRKEAFDLLDRSEWDNAANMFQSLSYHKPAEKEYKEWEAYARGKYRDMRDYWQKALAASNRGDLRAAESAGAEALKLNPDSPQARQFLASVRDDLGQEAWKRREFATALAYWERALQADPRDAVARENVGIARGYLDQLGQQGAAVANAQQAITQLAQTVQNNRSSGGLGLGDFDGGSASSAGRGAGDATGSTMVVDARNVSSGLPKAVDDVIAATYRNTSVAVGDRARKGFQAIATGDWKVARAWFQDALNRDPGNADLKRMVDLTDSTEKFYQNAANQNAALIAQPVGSPELAAAIQAKAKGDTAEAIRQLERTKVVYPESAGRVDRMIEQIRRQQAGAAAMADYQRSQAEFVVQMEQDSLSFLLLGNYREADRLSRDAAFFSLFVDRNELEAANARVWAPQAAQPPGTR